MKKPSKEDKPWGPIRDLYVHGNSQTSKQHKHANKKEKENAKKVVKEPGRVPPLGVSWTGYLVEISRTGPGSGS